MVEARESSDLGLPATAQLIFETSDPSDRLYVDAPLRPGTLYSYQVLVLTDVGAISGSNIVSAETLPLPTTTPTVTSTITATPPPTFTKTLTPTATATATSTPCPEVARTLTANGIGVGTSLPYAGVTWTISDEVVADEPKTLTVSRTLCWNLLNCGQGQVTVGPSGAPATACFFGNSDCENHPLPGLETPHAVFFYQLNNGPSQVAGGDPDDPSLPPYTFPDISGLKQNDRLKLNVNDYFTDNNQGGFQATVRYTYRACGAQP